MLRPHATSSIHRGQGRGRQDATVGGGLTMPSQFRLPCQLAPPQQWHAPSPLLAAQHCQRLALCGQRQGLFAARTLARASQLQMQSQQGQRQAAVPDNFTFHFTCPYETAFGERVCLVGGLPEMGSWKLESALELKWHEGHEWKLTMPLPRSRSNFEFKVVVVSDQGGSRWEEGNNRVVKISPELLEAPLNVTIDCRLEFEKTDASRVQVLLDAKSVQGPLELSEAWLELQSTMRARMQDALSRGTARAKALEEDLSALEAESASLQSKLEELRGLLGEQALEEGSLVALATEAGKVSVPSLLSKSLPPLTQDSFGQDYYATGLEVSTDSSALPLAGNGNGVGLEPAAAALTALQQRQQAEAEEKVRILEEAHRRQVEEVAALAAAEQREAEWQAQVQQQLARAQERQAQQQLAQQRQRPQAAPLPVSSSNAGLEGLAAWISSQYMGMGKSAADALPELRRRGIVCTGRNLFTLPGQPNQLDAEEVAQALRLQRRTPSRPSTPAPSRPPPSATHGPPPPRYASPPAAAFASSGADLERLADFISSNYMGMGKTAVDALPELRRKGITAVGPQLFSLNGMTMSAPEVAEALRLQARTPSQPVTPASSRPVSPAPAARAGPRAELRGASPPRASPAGSRSGSPSRAFDSELEGLAAWISEKYTGMGKSAADTLPELRRRGIMSCGWSLFSLPNHPEQLDADGVARVLRLKARQDSRSSSPGRSTSPIRTPAPQIQPAVGQTPAANTLEGLAAYISANYMGMGKSAADALPELRRTGITASSSGYSMGGQRMTPAEIAQALRLQPRTPSRPTTPTRSRPLSPSHAQPAAAAASSGSPSGLEGLAAWISTNYMGMGKSAADALPELRRKGITASGSSFSMGGQRMTPAEIAQALRLQIRTPIRPSTPIASRPAAAAAPPSYSPAPTSYSALTPASYAAPAASAASSAGLEGLAAWISANYMGMGKSAMDALPELRRRGIVASGNNTYSIAGNVMDAQGIAQALRLQPRTPSRSTTPVGSRSPSPPQARAMAYSAPAAPAASAGSPPGLEGLAAWISTNYMGMGKSAMDALPELRRKGITASGSSFSMGGQRMTPAEIAQALRLQPRPAGRPVSSTRSGYSSSAASYGASASTSEASYTPRSESMGRHEVASSETAEEGIRWLAAWIAEKYAGMGKTAADALPELKRRGITCTSMRAGQRMFLLPGQPTELAASEVANLLRLRVR